MIPHSIAQVFELWEQAKQDTDVCRLDIDHQRASPRVRRANTEFVQFTKAFLMQLNQIKIFALVQSEDIAPDSCETNGLYLFREVWALKYSAQELKRGVNSRMVSTLLW